MNKERGITHTFEKFMKPVRSLALAGAVYFAGVQGVGAETPVVPLASGTPISQTVPEAVPTQEIFSSFNTEVEYYHEIDYVQFKNHLGDLLSQGRIPISYETFVKGINGELTEPIPANSFMITIDDSLKSIVNAMRAVRELKAEGKPFIPLVIFSITKFDNPTAPFNEVPDNTPSYRNGVLNYATKGDLKQAILEGHSIQPHTVNHPLDLLFMVPSAADGEIKISDERVQGLYDEVGKKRMYRIFAYPYGRYNPGLVALVANRKFDAAFTTQNTTYHSAVGRFTQGRVAK